MLALISPAKTLDYSSDLPTQAFTLPKLLEYSEQLIEICRTFSPQDLSALMGISDKLATLNAARFESWEKEHNPVNARQALFAFKGDVYTGLDALSLDSKKIDYLQSHLRILSGLYGLLSPLDLIEPYRLEMGTKLANPSGRNLYDFWDQVITDEINKALVEQRAKVLLNCASDEYFSAVKEKNIKACIVKPVFLDEKNGTYKVISFYAKKARGLMVRFMADHNCRNVDDLKQFHYQGYAFVEAESSAQELIFKRSEAVAKLHK